jgi:hypothetical protein
MKKGVTRSPEVVRYWQHALNSKKKGYTDCTKYEGRRARGTEFGGGEALK